MSQVQSIKKSSPQPARFAFGWAAGRFFFLPLLSSFFTEIQNA
jgi:hypothetical protein